jgi:hypothetical protein
MQLTVTNMSQGTFPGPPPYQSLQTGGGGAEVAYTTAVRPTSAGYNLRNKFLQKLTVANVAAASYGRTHGPPGISK